MTTVNCPKCDEKVRVPNDASSAARVQCPLCVEEFDMAEALEKLAPMLVVLNDPGAPAVSTASTDVAFSDNDLVAEADEDAAVPEFSFEAPAAARTGAPEFAFESGSATSGSSASAARRARAQRPQKSAIKEMAKVVGGGVIGLTIGQLILWWLPGSLKRDPLELGPKIPAFAAFLVSPQFRAKSLTEQDSEPVPSFNQGGTGSTSFGNFGQDLGNELPSSSFEGMLDPNQSKPVKKQGKKKPAAKQLARQDGPDAMVDDVSATGLDATGDDQDTDGASSADGVTPLPAEVEADVFGAKPDIEVPMINLDAFPTAADTPAPPESAAADPQADLPAVPAPAGEPTPSEPDDAGDFGGVRNAPTITGEQLSNRLAEAVSASTAMDTSTDATARALARDYYLNLAGLGEAVTFVDQNAESDFVDEVGKFAMEVGAQPDRLKLIGTVAPNWMKAARPHNGFVVGGTVKSITFDDPYYVTSLELPNRDLLQVVSLIDPAADYQADDRVLILGSILESPRQNLKRYQGDAPTVILDGLHTTLPKSE